MSFRQITPYDDGGPAFPRAYSVDHNEDGGRLAQAGMTLRAYFAGKALQGYRASPSFMLMDSQALAPRCVADADALIAELSK